MSKNANAATYFIDRHRDEGRAIRLSSRQPDQPKQYVQDKLRERAADIAEILKNPDGHIYICGLKAMEHGVEAALSDIARGVGLNWANLRDDMRKAGRFHVETY